MNAAWHMIRKSRLSENIMRKQPLKRDRVCDLKP
jgi:hypothetical protein